MKLSPEPIRLPDVLTRGKNEITQIAEGFNSLLAECKRNLRDLQQAECERSAMADELAHADKLRTVGQLTGGIAHDFNNVLHVIVGNIELAEETPSETENCLDETKQAALKAAELTHHLLPYSRKQKLSPQVIV